ncbi:MAG: Ig-like domain-containing protein [Chloroflexota bacterium]|nr:Ig-like domain-containing protein [Chloroflexota bacterium]
MRSPKYRSITGRRVRLPLALVVMITAAAMGLSGAIGLLIGSAGGNQIIPTVAGVESAEGRPVRSTSAGIAVTNLTVAEGVDQPLHLGVGEEAQVRAQVALADGTSRGDAPVRWFSSDRAVLTVSSQGLVTGLAPGRARVHAVLPPFDASATVAVGQPGDARAQDVATQPDPDQLVALEQHLLEWVAWDRARRGVAPAAVDEPRRGALRALVAHALRQGDIDRVRVDGRQYQAAAAGGWAVRVWSVGTPAAWNATEMGELRGLIGDEAASVLTNPAVDQVAVGLVFDARVSDRLWAGVAVRPATP